MICKELIPTYLARYRPPAGSACVMVRELGQDGEPSRHWRLIAVDLTAYQAWIKAPMGTPPDPLGMSTRMRTEDETIDLHYHAEAIVGSGLYRLRDDDFTMMFWGVRPGLVRWEEQCHHCGAPMQPDRRDCRYCGAAYQLRAAR